MDSGHLNGGRLPKQDLGFQLLHFKTEHKNLTLELNIRPTLDP